MFDYSFEQPYRESNLINLQYKYFPVSLEFFLKIQLKHLPHFLLHKKSSFPSRFSLENVTKSTVSPVLITFTEEILDGKLHFLCSVQTMKTLTFLIIFK